jgi:hypothetical protein
MVDLRADLHSAYANGTWSGAGLTSDVAVANPASFAIGYIDNTSTDQLYYTLTVPGDANLDFQVTFADLSAVSKNYGQSTLKDDVVTWASGDFTYSGAVTFADLSIVSKYYGDSLTKAEMGLVLPPKTPLVVAPPPPLPTDGITNDTIGGVWNAISGSSNSIFAD